MRVAPSCLEIFLHDPGKTLPPREGLGVRISFFENEITSIARLADDGPVALLEIEPEEVTSFYGTDRERRQLVALKEVPQHLISAIMAAEDLRFYEHHGFDPRGMLRALYVNLRHLGLRQGGSTITQQLAKNYFLSPERTLQRKLKEMALSIVLEVKYTKDEILEMYLNEIYLGQKGSVSVNGVGEASYFYFGKPVKDLSLVEAATLAGLIKAPNRYSPYLDKERCRKRRNAVLQAMLKKGWGEKGRIEAALAAPVRAAGFTGYGIQAPFFMDYVAEQLRTLYPPEALTSLGLSIYTSLDTQVQEAAEKALGRGLARLEKLHPQLKRVDAKDKLQGALIVMQPKTGAILAMAGGRNYGVSQFNRLTQARRQPGSAFKPFVFLSALDKVTPVTWLANVSKSYEVDGKVWEPENVEPIAETRVTVRRALAKSINLATIELATQVGLERVVETAGDFQFSTRLKPYPSLALGAFEVVPLELARAYCAFAADGVLPYPLSVKEVVDEHGEILERRHMKIERVTTPAKAFLMSSLLRSVVTEGTARSLRDRGITFPAAGKTGTTNDFKDAWFVGYTPDVLALVWVGFDDNQSIQATGAAAALPIWADLMEAIPERVSGEWFRVPPGVVKRVVCLESGELAVSEVCPAPREEYFLEENAPVRSCTLHQVGPFKKLMRGIKDVFKKN